MIVFPNAKINLGLNVVAKRADGYHNLETVFYPVPIFDALEVLLDNSIIDNYLFSNSGIVVDCDAEKNLCIKAFNLLSRDFKMSPVKIHLHKTIPFGGGLGGGSADATFMLMLLNTLFDLKLSESQLIDYAVKLGADCPFFVKNSACFATGIGENLQPLELSLKGSYLVLLNPRIHISTAEAFSNIVPTQPTICVKDIVAQSKYDWHDLLRNDFESSVFPSHPLIEEIKKSLYADGAYYASMSGSGSSVYGLFDAIPTTITGAEFIVWQGQLQ